MSMAGLEMLAESPRLHTFIRHSTARIFREMRSEEVSATELVWLSLGTHSLAHALAKGNQVMVRSDTGERIEFPPRIAPMEIYPPVDLSVNINYATARHFSVCAEEAGLDPTASLTDPRFTGLIVDHGAHHLHTLTQLKVQGVALEVQTRAA